MDLFRRTIDSSGYQFCLENGEILGLVGASGSGKTTLLREIIGLETPSRGSLKVLGEPVQEACATECRERHNHTGVLFQNGALFSALNIFDNIAFPLRELDIDDEELTSQMVYMKLAMVGLNARDATLKTVRIVRRYGQNVQPGPGP